MKKAIVLFTLLSAFEAVSAVSVSDVIIRQRWPWGNTIDINYVVSGISTVPQQAVVKAYADGILLCTVSAAALSGDTILVSNGAKHIALDPSAVSEIKALGVISQFNINVELRELGLYMVVDLTKTPGSEGQITYLPEEALAAGTYGTTETNKWAENGVPPGGLIWTGVTNNPVYATTKLVFRRVASETFTMGSPETEIGRYPRETIHRVELSKPFYAGVFPVTQAQFQLIYGSNPSGSGASERCPVNNVNYIVVRGGNLGAGWPASSAVDEDSFMGKLRKATGLAFDLPTSAQWEYACRAGTTGAWNNGKDSTDMNTDPQLAVLGWYGGDGGLGNAQSAMPVGLKEANSWGLYDMHGNVAEWCLDYFEDNPSTAQKDPKGPANGGNRVLRGGGYTENARSCRSALPNDYPADSIYSYHGFRVFLTLQ